MHIEVRSQIMNCKCYKYNAQLTTVEEIRQRSSMTAEIENSLEEVEKDSSKWLSVLRCKLCGSLWAREHLPERYDPPCLYQIKTDNPKIWLQKSNSFIQNIYRNYEDKAFWQSLSDEVGPAECRHEGCHHKTIKNSIFCKLHHFEKIKQRTPEIET